MPKAQIKTQNEALLSLKGKFLNASAKPGIAAYRPYIDPDSGRSPQKEFHSSPRRGRLFIGGNRSGKTVGGGAESAMWLTGQHPFREIPKPPVRGRAIGVDFTNGIEKIIKPEIARWIPPSYLINGSWEDSYSKEFKTLTLNNGSFLEFMSYDQDVDKFAGTSRHFIWFDEEPPEAIYDENMMRLVDVGGHWWMTMTPVEGMTWVYDEIYEPYYNGENDAIFVVEVDTDMNPHVDKQSREEMFRTLTEDEKLARSKGRFVALGGLIYPQFSETVHVIDRVDLPKEWLHVASMDHGLRNPTAWLWGAIDPEGRIFVFDEHYASGLIVQEHAEIIHGRNARNKRIPDYYVGDPSIRNSDPITGTSILLEYMRYGIPIVLGNNDVKAGIDRVTNYLVPDSATGKPNIYITRNCENLIREMKRYRWATWANKKDEKKKNRKEEPAKKDDHACDSLRYLISSRPEMDTGTEVPVADLSAQMGIVMTQNEELNGFRDDDFRPVGVLNRDYAEATDYTLGGEW